MAGNAQALLQWRHGVIVERSKIPAGGSGPSLFHSGLPVENRERAEVVVSSRIKPFFQCHISLAFQPPKLASLGVAGFAITDVALRSASPCPCVAL